MWRHLQVKKKKVIDHIETKYSKVFFFYLVLILPAWPHNWGCTSPIWPAGEAEDFRWERVTCCCHGFNYPGDTIVEANWWKREWGGNWRSLVLQCFFVFLYLSIFSVTWCKPTQRGETVKVTAVSIEKTILNECLASLRKKIGKLFMTPALWWFTPSVNSLFWGYIMK